MKDKRRFLSTGKSKASVLAKLEETLSQEFSHVVAEMKEEQIAYDNATNHGLDRKAQKLARDSHSEKLKALQKKVKSPSGTPVACFAVVDRVFSVILPGWR